jgi:hypothetical protein
MTGIVGYLDKFLYRAVVTERNVKWEQKYQELRSRIANTSVGDVAIESLGTVNNKTQALLAHVSMMIAVLSLFAGLVIRDGVGHYLVIIEIMLYVLMTIGLLRCIKIAGSEEYILTSSLTDVQSRMIGEACYRRQLYSHILTCTVYITIAFMLSVAFHYLSAGHSTRL